MKYLSYEGLQYLYGKILTRLGLKVDVTGGDISETVIETLDTVEDKYPIPAAGESVKRFFGKVLAFMKGIRPLTSDITLYVSTTGSDILGDGTSDNPFKTIQHAIDSVPKDLGGHTVTITVNDGIYPEDVKITGFNNGSFQMYSTNGNILSDNCKINKITIFWCKCDINIGGFSIVTTTETGIYAFNCTNVGLQFIKVAENALSSGKSGFNLSLSTFSISNCQVSYRSTALFAYNSRGVSNSWATCTGNTYGLWSSYGSVVATTGAQPAAITPLNHDSGGMFINWSGTQISDDITYGLSCTWGTIRSGYVRHGNINGTAMISINARVDPTVNLSAGLPYTITGFPVPAITSFGTVSVAVDSIARTSLCSLERTGVITFVPSVNVTAGSWSFTFSATYKTNS